MRGHFEFRIVSRKSNSSYLLSLFLLLLLLLLLLINTFYCCLFGDTIFTFYSGLVRRYVG